jgi:hypothetical protein
VARVAGWANNPRKEAWEAKWRLAVDLAVVADAKDEDEHAGVFDFGDEAVVADAVLPELAEFGAVQGLSDAARILERGEALVKKLENAFALLRVEDGFAGVEGFGAAGAAGEFFEALFDGLRQAYG